MAIIFDGRKFAAEKEANLAIRVLGLKTRGVYPKLASILVGDDPASELYVNLKKKAAQRIGAEVDIYFIKKSSKVEDLILLINTLNEDKTVNGIMIQMPLPPTISNSKLQILDSIAPEKDIDGLRDDGPYLHPTSMAVIQILEEAKKETTIGRQSVICVVGAYGMVGKPLVRELKSEKYNVIECGSDTVDLKSQTLKADILITTTGVTNLIRADMVKSGSILIDVGSPTGDIEKAAYEKASFVSPVPGGVGPVTITCLLENLISAC